jgi:nucleotide-binding universal stress UspA family protein
MEAGGDGVSAFQVLCPVDFSEPSRAALRYAAAIADHLGGRLIVLAVDDPFLAEAAASAGFVPSLGEETARELQRLCAAVFEQPRPNLETRVRIGKPAVEILNEARSAGAGLIVMSSRGQTGVRKMFFGSTTERVLRETSVDVLVTPPGRPPGYAPAELARYVGRVLVPVALAGTSSRQVTLAVRVAQALAVPMLIAHVLEPIAIPARVRLALTGIDASRRGAAEDRMQEIAASASLVPAEALVVSGDPADEIVKLADARHANLIVMGLHSSELLGRRMGSVTYRVLASTHKLVLAVAPGEAG